MTTGRVSGRNDLENIYGPVASRPRGGALLGKNFICQELYAQTNTASATSDSAVMYPDLGDPTQTVDIPDGAVWSIDIMVVGAMKTGSPDRNYIRWLGTFIVQKRPATANAVVSGSFGTPVEVNGVLGEITFSTPVLTFDGTSVELTVEHTSSAAETYNCEWKAVLSGPQILDTQPTS